MSETKPQEEGTGPIAANAHRQWEWFWRIIAGLIAITIGWVAWVMYQIMPRSVVTPLVYEAQVGQSRAQRSAGGTPEVAAAQPPASALVSRPAPQATAADVALAQAQAAMRAGAHQASADVQAAGIARTEQSERADMLKLSTEITTPLAERPSPPK